MMTPDISLIIEIMLFAEGFQTSKVLSKKMTTLYHLMVQQLSKQDHYDFGPLALGLDVGLGPLHLAVMPTRNSAPLNLPLSLPQP